MRRFLLLLCLHAACGDNLDPPNAAPAPIEAVCDETDLDTQLANLPNVATVTAAKCGEYVQGAVRCYEVTIDQDVDHANPGHVFQQHLFLMHRGCDRPTVIADWGYSNDVFFDDELSVLFDANAIWVEHRYQGKSAPVGTDWDWKALTIENGANDLHRVIDSFKHLYGGHWVSTGASKGGITATYHSYFFPHDLDGAIPYVAPASRSRVDPRYQDYLERALTSPCAQRIRDAQVAAETTRKSMMLAKLRDAVGEGIEQDYLDLMTASFDWGFWQYYGQRYCSQVPADTASDDVFWSFYAQMSGFFGPADTAQLADGALSYEWLSEQGFALQIGKHVKDLLQSPYATMTMEQRFRNDFPDVELPTYDGSVTRAARHWAETYADNMLLIYGELDPWSGGALDAPERPTSARFFAPGQTHGGAQIATLTPADRVVALDHAARMFGEPPVMALMQQASDAADRRMMILGRHEQRFLMRLP